MIPRPAEPVVLAFVAPWCGPCRRLEPILDEVAEGHRTEVRLEKVRVDEHPELAERYGVRSTPTLVAARGDEELARSVGAMSRTELDGLFALAASPEAVPGGVGRVGHRTDLVLRLGAGASLVVAGLALGPNPALLIIGVLVALSGALR